MTVGQVFSMISLMCSKYPIPNNPKCYSQVFRDSMNEQEVWKTRCCPDGYVFRECVCVFVRPGMLPRQHRVPEQFERYPLDGMRAPGMVSFRRHQRNPFDRRVSFRRIVNSPRASNRIYLQQGTNLRPFMRRHFLSRDMSPNPRSYEILENTPGSARQRMYPDVVRPKYIENGVYPLFENIPLHDLQGVSKVDRVQLYNGGNDAAYANNEIPTNTIYNKPLSNSAKKSNAMYSYNSKTAMDYNPYETLSKLKEFAMSDTNLPDTSTLNDRILLIEPNGIDKYENAVKYGGLTNKKVQFVTDKVSGPRKEQFNYLPRVINDKSTIENVLNRWRLNYNNVIPKMKPVTGNKANEPESFRAVKEPSSTNVISNTITLDSSNTKVTNNVKETSAAQGKSDTNIQDIKSTTTSTKAEIVSKKEQKVKKKTSRGYSIREKVVTVDENNAMKYNGLNGKENVHEVAGNVIEGLITLDHNEKNIPKFETFKTEQNVQNITEVFVDKSKEKLKEPSMTIDFVTNETVAVPLESDMTKNDFLEKILQSGVPESAMESFQISKDKTENLTVIKLPVEKKENSLVKGITFKVPHKIGKYFENLFKEGSLTGP